MKTRRVRRWLLVQLVSVPVGQEQEADETHLMKTKQQERFERGLDSLAFEKMMVQQSRTWI
jgi:hypothetical protein